VPALEVDATFEWLSGPPHPFKAAGVEFFRSIQAGSIDIPGELDQHRNQKRNRQTESCIACTPWRGMEASEHSAGDLCGGPGADRSRAKKTVGEDQSSEEKID
jgi:hypothetical protein